MPKPTDKSKGFDSWIDLFKSGKQTDSKGRTQNFTHEDLDSIVSNHNAQDPAPIVVGHPKDCAPAFGWTHQLRRQGDVLQGRFKDVVSEFEKAVQEKRYRKRSISIEPDGKGGFKLNHVGFLGAMAPAVSGLKDIEFSSDDNAMAFEQGMDTFEFSHSHRSIGWALNALANLFRGQREQIIEEDGIEKANEVMPSYQIETLSREAEKLLSEPESSSAFSSGHNENHQESDMTKEEQERLENENALLKAQLKTSSFQQRVAESQVVVDDALKRGALTPAQAKGMVEFMSTLPGDESSVFEFSVGNAGETKKETPRDYLKRLLMSFGKQVPIGESNHESPQGQLQYQSPTGEAVDPDDAKLHQKALEYQKQHPGTSYVNAVLALDE
ncbi:hypothetical protein QF117_10605 [Vibrio sp. YMD68]|uniref:hypothetical protein n=1 Tax=Vibrio sp. YMD68 TaxID=3042300 RepID=UPI00249C0009|nr:hypothetical protein [Vibrio sp. YMD68]WGV98833.1 hypothetical protein QF117_02405 [Vibrio sp. YMD68]WGW01240.1 hypothetical protein QF117_10605 [Vibrio sp. YMD68]